VPILIDGHNLVGKLSMLSLEDPDDEEMLVRLLQPYQARSGKAITVVFDPGPGQALPRSRRLGRIEVVFAPQGSSADAVIARRVQQSRDPGSWLVVTSDLELANTVRRQGAKVQSADDLAGQLASADGESLGWKEDPPSLDDVEDWLALFGKQD
jgi:predicted RNA-binding protein with PIN domain